MRSQRLSDALDTDFLSLRLVVKAAKGCCHTACNVWQNSRFLKWDLLGQKDILFRKALQARKAVPPRVLWETEVLVWPATACRLHVSPNAWRTAVCRARHLNMEGVHGAGA